MKMIPRAWFNRSRILMNAAENITFSANDPAGESSPRSELFSTVQMERYGQKLARTHKVSPDRHPYYLLKRLGDNEAVITQNCYELNAGKKTSIMPAGEWLLDNYYLIEEQIRTVRQHLPKSFGKGLPSLVSPLNCPRIYHIASEAIAHGDGRWDAASLTSYLTAYQQVTPLTLGEVWALPGMLRLALIENLRRISMEVIKAQQDRNLADTWITRIVECAESAPGDLIMVVADMARSRPPLTSAFVAELVRRLQGHGNALSLPLTWVDQCLREQGITTDVLIHSFNQQLAASQLSVSNSIAGLRLLSETDWADFAETISVVEQALRNDPAGIYPRMHFNTRDHYRHVVEVLARDSGLSEPEVAEKALAFSEEKAPDTPEHHVGYYLAGEGRQALDIHLLADASRLIRLRHSFNRITLLSWLGSLALLTTAATAAILHETAMQGADWLLIAVILPLIIALTQLMSDLLSDATTRFRVPRPLPGMDFSAGIPADSATMLVIPCMLTSHESFSQLLTSLEVCWLGNENENLRFALLTDFADSENEPSPESHALLRQAIADTQALNRRYPSGRPRFYLLHRQPEWNPSEGAWMGYERKRGKLALLNSWLRHPGTQFVSVAEMPAHLLPGHIKYVITLDSDTVLPRDTAHKLVATMAHPLNTPEYDPVRQRVVKGFGILQPGLAEEIPRNGQGRYAALRSSVPGNNPYSMMSSDIYQDLFGEGSFVGKGIYDVDIFMQATTNICPENLVLSHDLLEGCYARSGLLSEVLLYEQYPNNYLSDVARRSRWIRGDWQLLNWLKPRVRKADGTRVRNPLPDAVDLYSPRRHFESHEGMVKPVRYEPRIFYSVDTPAPDIQLLSNGHYHLMLTAGGGGYSRWNDIALTRWRSDTTRYNWGAFCYIRDTQTGDVWSNTWQPTGYTSGQDEEVLFTDAGAEFRRSLGGLSVKTQVVISPEDDVELRRLTLIHRGRKPRSLELTTYAEVVLAPDVSDLAHPAFSNLFIQTELAPERDAILCHRRPRSPDEPGPCLFHMMVVHGDNRHNVSFETDRARFIGRGRNPANAQAIETGGMLGNTSGSVLDPILAIRNAIILQPGQPVTIDIIYGISETRQQSLALLEKYRDYPIADRVFELAWSHSLVVLRQMNASEDDATLFNSLASAVLYPVQELRAEGQAIGRNRRGQSGLWGWAISGDLPIVLLSITSEESITSVTTLIQAHRYWRQKGLDVDLVILNNSPGGYQQGLQNQIMELIYAGSEASLLDKKGGLFVRNGEHLSAEDKLLLMSVACLYLDDRAGGINEQLNQRIHTLKSPARAFIPRAVRERNQHTDWSPDTSQLCHFNGYGGFSQDGREYQIVLRENALTPAPWSNILANSRFGSVISEAGQAYTWYENAHEYRLTPWENDPVSDRSGEAFYLRDEESGECWSPTALPVRGHGDYLTRHGFGYSVFAHRESGIDSELTVLVAEEDPIKLVLLTLSNSSGRTRQLSVTGYVEWTLGETRTRSAPHIVTHVARTPGGCGVLANNFYGDNGGGRTAFFAVSGNDCSLTGDRREFIGRNGSLHAPSAMKLQKLSGKTGAGLDPCGAVQSAVTLIDGDQRTFIFILGAEENDVCAQETLARYMNEDTVRQELNRIHNHWHNVLDKIVVNTPDTSVNLLVNGWLLYQTVACRLMARSGYYQSGGAFGFRDQLQDTLALSHAAPDRMREQIILCASRQFIEGDVQHWWHPPHGNGVRTRCSDDYLWLPLAACHYVETTGDMDALEIRIPYLEGRSLQPGEESVYDTPVISGTEETLWLHCVKAIHYGLRFGEHGLPLMGAGDWNDGMNRVGIEGKGESVWLGFFLYDILQRFAALAERRLDESVAAMCRSQALRLQSNLEAHAWDGEWYRRGYFDDGTPLGSKTSQDCRIDAIAQSWSVLSGAASPGRCAKAMQALDKHLVDNEGGLIKLLTPPFDGHGPNPGYIQGYLPGVRENGGQYTHGAIWAVMAFARMGNAERAWQLWSMLSPVNHTLNADSVGIYKAEPYVMSADVYSVAPHTGRAGWSWYTGSAGWAWRLLTEELLGIKRSGTDFSVHARLPDEWSSFSMAYQYGESHYQISVSRGDAEYCVTLDGVLLPDDRIPLKDDGQNHTVEIIQN